MSAASLACSSSRFARVRNASFISLTRAFSRNSPSERCFFLLGWRPAPATSVHLSDTPAGAFEAHPLSPLGFRGAAPVLRRLFSSFTGQRTSASPQVAKGKWWGPDTVAVVTGANKGIGYYIVRRLAREGVTTVLAVRDPGRGEEAARKLRQEEGLPNVEFHQMDTTDVKSIDAFARWLQEKYGGLDILVNNAGMAYKGNVFGADEAAITLGTNYQGTRAVCERLLPLLRASPHGARVVNVCSGAGKLRIVGPQLRARLSDDALTLDELDKLVGGFVDGIRDGTYRANGWPSSMYGVSKVAEAAYTRVLARQLAARPEGQKVLVNACCPGWCTTDMTSGGGVKSADEGADTPVFLALQAPTSGAFFSERREEPF